MDDDGSFIPKELVGKDIYQILGLTFEDAKKDNIKNIIRKRYLKSALLLHPDKLEASSKGTGPHGTGPQATGTSASNTERFNTLKSAYEFLMNEQLRNKYNLYIAHQKTKKKKNNPSSSNISLSRFLDKRKLDAQQQEKWMFKRKLEAREREMANRGEQKNKWKNNPEEWGSNEKSDGPTESSYQNGKNSRKKKNSQQNEADREQNNLEKIKKQNEDFVRRHSSHPSSQKKRQKNVCQGEDIGVDVDGDGDGDGRDRVIEVYLDNYPHNVDLLQRYIEQKELLTVFLDFNIQKYYLNRNEEQTQCERRVGMFSFSNRTEAIRAYLHFKKNGKHIDRHFKLRLAVPCNEGVEMRSQGESPQKGGENEKPTKDNVDRMMNEMVDELDKMFSL
ncbi:DnaJ domain containing protein [Plasmodium knowlesi strain H]|uniref:DnaJ domain containing protein n=3 Tax=Plasmodium knowlesi TaxID=5850 RepID=A0A5K1VLS6_PLAKH|nr:DnaJ protein, putative [Plasmodium knowlesi strain H]OTN67827.1 DnaJ domain containing protein [Plasmodium knowlesi]CAA9990388.1 DnaJ protein, putative [Plasmodium knowlesi strain H]SBO19594.1 DnaJ domain containing protein [Plasmodium knowlesi strain H]SBO22639.1 DnaJ domain containing protein [Plasmodium knowlesi strain H]VVS79862.1 DnaJ protein, putative [Plasmodium knowlesi strain H]|eukprot:XP_002260788.1 DnaJ domain containing protein [Plasmodium knowlesi strain H]